MNTDPEPFAELQKLLAVKRHETPPPRFFVNFSEAILDRLHGPAAPEPQNWWQRLGFMGDFKPALVCAWGVAVCAALVIGIIASVHVTEREPEWASDLTQESIFVGGMMAYQPGGFPIAAVTTPVQASLPSSIEPIFAHPERVAELHFGNAH